MEEKTQAQAKSKDDRKTKSKIKRKFKPKKIMRFKHPSCFKIHTYIIHTIINIIHVLHTYRDQVEVDKFHSSESFSDFKIHCKSVVDCHHFIKSISCFIRNSLVITKNFQGTPISPQLAKCTGNRNKNNS